MEKKDKSSVGGWGRMARIAFFTVLTLSLLFTMWKLVYDGPRIGGIDNVSLFFLLNLNIILLLMMGLLIGRNLVKLSLDRHSKIAGARFQTKLVVSFLGLALIPSVLLFLIASGLITNSIDNWSNVTVERSLRDSLEAINDVHKKAPKTPEMEKYLVEKTERISRTYREFEELKHKRFPIKAMYAITLLLVTLVILFGSTWFGFYLAKDITGPIQKLMEATKKVTEGDLSVRLDVKSRDEIGVLTESFNSMTKELDASAIKVEQSHAELLEINQELDRRRKYIETILANIAAGVISIDGRGRISTCNPSAASILGLKDANFLGRYYESVLEPGHLETIRDLLREMGKSKKDYIKKETEVTVRGARRTLLMHISYLKDPDGAFMGMVAVFEDITAVLNVEKVSAWRDIAQYMAHEIKNPLTPIRLNAERLQRNFRGDKEAFDKNFDACTGMIIQEVEVLRTLVDEFSRFAQLPEAAPEMVDLNVVMDGVVQMYEGIKPGVVVKTDYDPVAGMVRMDKEQMHRVFRNLIENAVDAVGEHGVIEVRTRLDAAGKRILIDIMDDGPGIEPNNLEKIFMPHFSTKKKGTGLGLAIANRIVADHDGQISPKNRSPHGTIMTVELPTSA